MYSLTKYPIQRLYSPFIGLTSWVESMLVHKRQKEGKRKKCATNPRLQFRRKKNSEFWISRQMLLYLIHDIFLSDWWSMTHHLLYVTFWFTAHHVFPGFLCTDSCLTVFRHIQPGLCFNEPGPQGEKNNYLFRHQGEESLTPPHLFHVCIYSGVAEGSLSVCFCHFLTGFCPEPRSLSLHGRGDKWWVTQQAGGQTPWPNYLSVFPHFLASFSLCLSLPFLPNLSLSYLLSVYFYACKSFTLLFLPCPPSLPSIYLSLSLMNISHRNAIYRRYIVPPLHPSSSDFSSAHFIQLLSDWGWVSCHFQLSSIFTIKPFFSQSLMHDGRFSLSSLGSVYHRSTFIDVFVTEEQWFDLMWVTWMHFFVLFYHKVSYRSFFCCDNLFFLIQCTHTL